MTRSQSALARQLDRRKGGYLTGRKPEEWPPLPAYSNHQIDAVAGWMQSHRANRRPLSVAAPLLAVVCGLYEQRHHLPTRARLAAEIGCSKDGIDAALSTAIAYGEIVERHETVDGAVARRRSTRRLRYIDPSPALWQIWRAAAPRAPGGSPPAAAATLPLKPWAGWLDIAARPDVDG